MFFICPDSGRIKKQCFLSIPIAGEDKNNLFYLSRQRENKKKQSSAIKNHQRTVNSEAKTIQTFFSFSIFNFQFSIEKKVLSLRPEIYNKNLITMAV
jgi:hypothetical protein